MSNFVEGMTWESILEALNKFRPDGVCIDVGIGDQDFYFEWFHWLDYPVVAVEPVPTPLVEKLCAEYRIPLIQQALAAKTGGGLLHYTHDGQIRSLSPVWGDNGARSVDTLSLPDLWRRIGKPKIAALKLDIEGVEFDVLRKLPSVKNLPFALAFEIGGFFPFRTGQGRWTPQALRELSRTLAMLWRLGYQSTRAITMGQGQYCQTVRPDEPLALYGDAEWGNIVAVREDMQWRH